MIDGILLAAGFSERFGANKLLHELDGHPLFRHSLRACLRSRLNGIHVVVGHDAGAIRKLLDSEADPAGRLRVVENPNPGRGLMSSVKCGLRALSAGSDGAMVLLADMPWVKSADIDRLISTFERDRTFVLATVDDEPAHPRIIPRAFFERFYNLRDNDKGSRIFEAERTIDVPLSDARSAWDVDVPGDMDPRE